MVVVVIIIIIALFSMVIAMSRHCGYHRGHHCEHRVIIVVIAAAIAVILAVGIIVIIDEKMKANFVDKTMKKKSTSVPLNTFIAAQKAASVPTSYAAAVAIDIPKATPKVEAKATVKNTPSIVVKTTAKVDTLPFDPHTFTGPTPLFFISMIRKNAPISRDDFRDWMITPIIHHSSTNNYPLLHMPSVRLRAVICIINSKRMKSRSSILNTLIGKKLERVALAEMIIAGEEGLIHNLSLTDDAVTMNAYKAVMSSDEGIRRVVFDMYPEMDMKAVSKK